MLSLNNILLASILIFVLLLGVGSYTFQFASAQYSAYNNHIKIDALKKSLAVKSLPVKNLKEKSKKK